MNVRICGDVIMVVEDEEGVTDDGTVECDDGGGEQERQNRAHTSAAKEGLRFWRFFRLRLFAALDAYCGERFGAAHFLDPIQRVFLPITTMPCA